MFSYYGSKSKIINHYPPPKYNTIVEPFAGSARYALRYHDRNVLLNDLYSVVADIWKWMIAATPEDIDALPDLQKGQDLRTMDLDPVIRNLLGFVVNQGVAYPHNIVSTWSSRKDGRIGQQKRCLHKYAGKLRHWQISNMDYRDLPNVEATWYVDPPYKTGGARYVENQIDYGELADWCRSRKGQVIVCENGDANWLPFRPLVGQRGQRDTWTKEVIWTNQDAGG